MVYNSKLTLSAQHVGIPEEHKGKNPTPHPAPRFPRHRLPCISLSVNNPFNFALGKRALTLGEAGICTLDRCGGLWEKSKVRASLHRIYEAILIHPARRRVQLRVRDFPGLFTFMSHGFLKALIRAFSTENDTFKPKKTSLRTLLQNDRTSIR